MKRLVIFAACIILPVVALAGVRRSQPFPPQTLWSAAASLAGTNPVGGYSLAAGRTLLVSAVTGRVTTASGAGAGSTVVTLSDGTNTCTATLLCTASNSTASPAAIVGFTIANGAGTGCRFVGPASIAATTSTAGCTTTQPTVQLSVVGDLR
jgi:hypothetical protein